MKPAAILDPKFGLGVIAAVDRDGKSIRIISEKFDDPGVAAPPVPGNKCHAGSKMAARHEIVKCLKIQKSVTRFQGRIINDQAGAGFLRLKARFGKGPFDKHDNRRCRKKMIANVKIPAIEPATNIDDFSG